MVCITREAVGWIGEKLVESPHYALVELVRNAYDADAVPGVERPDGGLRDGGTADAMTSARPARSSRCGKVLKHSGSIMTRDG